jgi:hypothetical protein
VSTPGRVNLRSLRGGLRVGGRARKLSGEPTRQRGTGSPSVRSGRARTPRRPPAPTPEPQTHAGTAWRPLRELASRPRCRCRRRSLPHSYRLGNASWAGFGRFRRSRQRPITLGPGGPASQTERQQVAGRHKQRPQMREHAQADRRSFPGLLGLGWSLTPPAGFHALHTKSRCTLASHLRQ